MTDKAYLIDKIAKLQAELSEKDRVIKRLAEYINGLDIDEDVCKKVKYPCHERDRDCLKCIIDVLGRGKVMGYRYHKGYIYNGHTFVLKKSDIVNATDDEFVSGMALLPNARQTALQTGICPMCEDCPDGCPIETPKDSKNKEVYGEWELLDECSNAGVYCSVCHKAVFKESAWYKNVHIKSKYCPNCGAKMDKEATP